jgi:superfamily II DNA or RNA helicase
VGLRDLKLQKKYRTNDSDIVNDFYVPCLTNATYYQRAVGYFTSGGLIYLSRGLKHFMSSGGRIELVASPYLSEPDVNTINEAYDKKDQIIEESLLKELDNLALMKMNSEVQANLSCLGLLVASGRLEIKLALPIDERNSYKHGIYHEKIGIISDQEGAKVAFSGSSNETVGGLINNFESIMVFKSWNDPEERVPDLQADFDHLWDDTTEKIKVIPFPEAAREKLIRFHKYREAGTSESNETDVREVVSLFTSSKKWRHQDDALQIFFSAEKGILEMATGTGKTHTALKICKKLIEQNLISTVIVTADGTDLLNQWCNEIYRLLKELDKPFPLLKHYERYHEREHFLLDQRDRILVISRPMLSVALKTLAPETASRTLLIHDEIHRMGSEENRRNLRGLAKNIRFRLGLSATPEREYDREGSDFILAEIGPVIFKFGLENAIRRRILCPFNYFPVEYIPNEEDRMRIKQIVKWAEAQRSEGLPVRDEDIWIKIASVYKTSEAKLPVFEMFIASHQDLLKRCIIFVETREYGNKVLDIVHKYRHDFHTYYAAEDSATLKSFARGDIECLITCHRLSEGIDIRNLSSVILFSSARAKLETIQRIGRCLRVDPENPDKIANVVDLVRSDAAILEETNADEERQSWLYDLSMVRPEEI